MRNTDAIPYLFYTFLLFAFVASLFVVPFLESNPSTSETGRALFLIYRPMCHQLPSRSFFVFGKQMPVCSRDFGIYFGMLLGALAFPFISGIRSTKLLPVWILIGSMVPIGIDGGVQLVSQYTSIPFIGTYESNNPLRLATGLLIGMAMSFYAIPLLNGIWQGLEQDMEKGDRKER